MAVRENYVMQKESRKEKSICPNCIHHNLCIAENNQPCFECNRFIDANGVTVQEWIPVTERVPDYSVPSTFYLCYWNGYIRVCKYWRTRNVFELRGKKVNVTHWMPLPEPPKEVE